MELDTGDILVMVTDEFDREPQVSAARRSDIGSPSSWRAWPAGTAHVIGEAILNEWSGFPRAAEDHFDDVVACWS